MKRYTAFIAPTDDFHGTGEELPEAWQNDHPAVYHNDFEVPDGTPDRLIVLIARGLFWEDQWSMDDTVFNVVEDLSPEDTRPLYDNSIAPDDNQRYEDVCDLLDKATDVMNPVDPEDFAGSVKSVDVWGSYSHPHQDDEWDDKVNW